MLPSLDPERIIDVIDRRAANARQVLVAYWYSVDGPRETYAKRIMDAHSVVPIVPLIPRKPGMFEAPNALISDLVELIDDSRDTFASVIDGGKWRTGGPLAILILSRSAQICIDPSRSS